MHWKAGHSGGALGKLWSAWRHGVYVGVKGKSGEIVVADEQGVFKTRTVQRKPLDERWDPKYLDVVNAVPWKVDETGEKEPHTRQGGRGANYGGQADGAEELLHQSLGLAGARLFSGVPWVCVDLEER